MSLTKADMLITSSEDDLYIESMADFLDNKLNGFNSLLEQINNIPDPTIDDDGEVIQPTVPYTGENFVFPVTIDGTYYYAYAYDVFLAVENDRDTMTVYDNQSNAVVDGIQVDSVLTQISDSMSAVALTGVALRTASDAAKSDFEDVVTHFTSRVNLTFAGMTDSVKTYGLKMASILGDVGMTVRDRVDSILSYVGINKTSGYDSLPLASGEFSDITGANPWITIAKASWTSTGMAAACLYAAAKYGAKLAAAIKKSAAFRKFKRFLGTVTTTSDAFNYKFLAKEFPGFGDYAARYYFNKSAYGYKNGVLSPYYSDIVTSGWIKADCYRRVDLPLGRLYFHLPYPNEDDFWVQYFVTPTSEAQVRLAMPTISQNSADFDDLRTNVSAASIDDICNLNSIVSSNGYIEHTSDAALYKGIQLAHLINIAFLTNMAYGTNSVALAEEIRSHFDYDDLIMGSVPNNPTNADLLKLIILQSDYSNTTYIPASRVKDPNAGFAMLISYMIQAMEDDQSYIPYISTTVLPSGRYSVKTDTQQLTVVLITIAVVAAVAIAVATGIRVARLKRKSFTLQAKAGTLSWRAFDPDAHLKPEAQAAVLKNAWKCQRKADRIQRLISGTQSVAESAPSMINQALSGLISGNGAMNSNAVLYGSSYNDNNFNNNVINLNNLFKIIDAHYPRN